MDQYKAKSDIKQLSERLFDMNSQAERENRDLTREEVGVMEEMRGAIISLTKELPQAALTVPGMGNLLGGTSAMQRKPGAYTPIEPGHPKNYQNLFGDRGETWAKMGGPKDTDFFSAVHSGRHSPGLQIQNAASISQPDSGGFIVPSDTASQIHDIGLESDFVMPRAWVVPMKHGEIKVPATQIGDHSSSLMGGFTASWTEEAGTSTEASPKVREIDLKAKKLVGLIKYSAELYSDSQGGQDAIVALCGKGLGWYRLKAWLTGSGSGEPQGVQNAACLVSIDKETGQNADTIMFENILAIMAQFYMPGFTNSVWVTNPSCIPQLLSMSLSVGTGGAPIQPAMVPDANGNFILMTRPVIFSEFAPTLGDANDIMLCDFSQYAIGLTEDMRYDQSIHASFTSDEIYSRIITRVDGSALWDSTLTLASGQEVSPFIGLAERA